MKNTKLLRYAFLSISGVFLLFVIPFIIAQGDVTANLIFGEESLFRDEVFMLSLKNSVIFMIIFIPIVVIVGYVLAYFTEHCQLGLWFQLAVILPIVTPALGVSGFFKGKIYGNLASHLNGIFIVGIIFVWATVGYAYLAILISLKNRDKNIEEAAYLDGASTFKIIRSMILPMHSEALVLATILSIYNCLKLFKYTYAIFGEIPDLSMFQTQNYLYIKLKKFEPGTLIVAADIFLMVILITLLLVVGLGEYRKKKLFK
ncbi:ABC-type sugar transport system, permease component [Hathewaya proteolytica DSM 3090]|uniref:ABC-type sugar transport system, permease component n=1 Tax=Hathewaya proteolytica DSM 3090 TaxID=1121331 RepID=A0A1M6MRV1_9CLOT|nr:ABC transporter permease subunit [Hathewaya proteolytica]SHJ86187.1 ABC-type sugar transport system, permease component [Hathewaya proteolytica DSM 3090]